MKKWTVLCLCLLLALALGCGGNAAQTPEAAENTPEPQAEVVTITPPEAGVPLVQLTSLDYDQATEQVLVNFVRMQFKGDETDYQIVAEGDGEIQQLKLGKDALIDLPMKDDFAKTVTVTSVEFPTEYNDYLAANEGATLLFTMTENNGEITSLRHFYTP